MTDTDMLELLRGDFKGVEKSVNNLSGKMVGVETAIQKIDKSLDDHNDRITETREAQLRCEAAGGWKGINREMRDVKAAQREDATGQTDVPQAVVIEKVQTNSNIIWGAFKTFGPWIALVLVLLGVWLGSGGDKEKTRQWSKVLNNLHKINLKVEKIEKNKTEPVHVPVPVSSECISEEVLP
ncbi:MAG: hypothetical protein U9Q07_04320 [Planctomycetota bacterium]|nr:hypothetical protein [Planctomycetota bacterium]